MTSTLAREKNHDKEEISIRHSTQKTLRKEVKSLKDKVHEKGIQVEDCIEVVEKCEMLENASNKLQRECEDFK